MTEYLYATEEAVKKASNIREATNYYVIENNENYGIKVANTYADSSKNSEIVMNDVSKDKKGIESLIDELMDNGNNLAQIQYIVEDYAKRMQ